MNKIIELKNVNKIYKTKVENIHILKNINLAFNKGDFISIQGKSGSGKTSLLNILGLLDEPTDGEIYIGGEKIHYRDEKAKTVIRNKKIGFVFQFHYLLNEFTALENVMMPALINKSMNKNEIKKKAKELLALVGLAKRVKHKPMELSGGEKQRVAIARAMINDPDIILADEPTGNLDTETSNLINELFMKINRERNQSIIIVTHSLELANLATYKYKIVGFVQGADHVEVSSNNVANVSYFGYILKDNFAYDSVSGVNIKLKNMPSLYSSKEYIDKVNKVREDLISSLASQQEKDAKDYKDETLSAISSNESKLAEGKKTLNGYLTSVESLKNVDNTEYSKQLEKLNKQKAELDSNEKQLKVARKAAENENYPRINVDNIRGLENYAQFIDSADSLKFVANVFSIFLFVVSLLVSLTTLTRMIDENRINIGTLKSLGYSNWSISKKYYVYGVLSAIIGTILGIIGAYTIVVPIIYNSYARFYTLNKPMIVYSPVILLSAFVLAIGCIMLAIYIPLRKNLKEKSAYLLRPKAPSGGSRIILERIPFIWKRLSFLRKVTFRNIFRYKVRMMMTIFGVLGCLTLMFIGFGIRYGVVDISKEQFGELNKVDIVATYNPYIDKDDIDNISKEIQSNEKVERYAQINMQLATIEKNHDVLDSVQLLALNRDNYKDYITLKNGNDIVELPKEGIAINEKLAYLHNLSVGDNFSMIVNNKEYTFKVGAVVKNYFGHIAYMDQNYYKEVFGKDYQDNTFMIKTNGTPSDVENISKKLSDNANIVNIVDNSKIQVTLDNAIQGIDIIVAVMVACSLMLALVVLYNLINVNVSERIRELSTIKVLGFYPSEVTIYVFREIFYLSIVGIILGNYLGYQLYLKIILELAARNMMFSSEVPIIVYVLASSITILITIVVMLIMHRRLKKVNMVEALKAIE